MTARDRSRRIPPDVRFGPAAAAFRWEEPEFDRAAEGVPEAALATLLGRRLDEPTHGPPLRTRLEPPVLIVLPDATRSTAVRTMSMTVHSYLDACGVREAERRVLIAGGMHRAPHAQEIESLLGRPPGALSLTLHDAEDAGALVECGRTSRGTPIQLNRALFDAGSTILIGGITGHYFAGFTGGMKGLAPAAAGQATIFANHRLAVDATAPSGLHLCCREGNLAGNPVHADMVEAARRAPTPFLVNAVLGAAGEPVSLVTGDPEPAHAHGVEIARRVATPLIDLADLVVVSTAAAGRARDWLQGHKVARQGAACLRDGGVLIARLPCADGLGSSSLLPWFDVPEAELAARVSANYTLHGHTALAMRALCRRVTVHLISELEPALVEKLGMRPAATVAEALAAAAEELPPASRAIALERAGALLPPVASFPTDSR